MKTNGKKIWRIALPTTVVAVPLCLLLLGAALPSLNDWARESASGEGDLLADASREPTVETTRLAPDLLQQVPEEDAIRINLERRATSAAIPSASPFILRATAPLDRERAEDCLAAAIYYEAATETHEGQAAVAQVVLNRLRSPLYPPSVCEVVFQGAERTTGCQFSFACDGSMRRTPSAAGWKRARDVANAALSGHVHSQIGWATHYHADYVVPYWAPKLVKLKSIGRHIFYGWPGTWNKAAAFGQRYAGAEPGIPTGTAGQTIVGLHQLANEGQFGTQAVGRAIPAQERPVLYGARDRAETEPAASRPTENRWVLVAPSDTDQAGADKLPL